MPNTISAAFAKFQSNLEITNLQSATVSTTQSNVRGVIDRRFVVLEDFQGGSYARNTMIAPLSTADVDIFVVLDPKYYSQHTPASLLGAMKNVLKASFPSTDDIAPDGQCVRIQFSNFKIDVVPCFNRQGGGLLLPNENNGLWFGSDPKAHIALWTQSNRAHNGNLVPVMKMMKAWNKKSGAYRSFALEVLVRNVLANVTITNHWSAVRYVFDKLRPFVRTKVADPSGFNDDICSYISTEAEYKRVEGWLAWSFEKASRAENLGDSGRIKEAHDAWREIFGDYFPAY
jgi:Second Messenger Oligonucleotide or Dinucleotide Synthetase domain